MVQTVWNEAEQVKQIPGARYNAENRWWTLPRSWAACVQLRGVFGPTLTIGQRLNEWALDERNGRVDLAVNYRSLLVPQPGTAPAEDRLYKFQRAGVNFLSVADSALLGDEMGTGKTIQLLESLRMLNEVDFNGVFPALVICPNSVKFNWQRESERWTPSFNVHVVAGSLTERRKLLEKARQDPLAVVVINFEGLRAHSRLAGYGSQRLKSCNECNPKTGFPLINTQTGGANRQKCETHELELNTFGFKTVIVDEAHRIKDPNAKQTRACWAVGHGKTVTRRFAATGTPIANDPSDLWSLMHFVAPEEYPRKTLFVDRYCLMSWGTYGGLEVKGLKPETRDEFRKIFEPRFRRVTKLEAGLQLPPKVRIKREVALSPKQRKAYNDIEKGLITRLPDGSVMVAPNDLVAQTRLLQFASATMESTADGFTMCDPSAKIDQLMEDLDDLGDAQVAVCAEYRQLIYLAASRLSKAKISYGLITGAQQPWERDVFLRDFQNGRLRVMLFTLKAGGTGLTMTAAGTLIRLQRAWSMIDNMQGEDRVHRIGSEIHSAVNIIDYVATGTVEDTQVERLWEKSQRLEEINRDRERLKAAGYETTELDALEDEILNSYLGD